MELYRKHGCPFPVREATTEDVQRWLAERGLVAVPVEMTQKQWQAGTEALAGPAGDTEDAYKAMIKAAQEQTK